jgi:hypothetical protein
MLLLSTTRLLPQCIQQHAADTDAPPGAGAGAQASAQYQFSLQAAGGAQVQHTCVACAYQDVSGGAAMTPSRTAWMLLALAAMLSTTCQSQAQAT